MIVNYIIDYIIDELSLVENVVTGTQICILPLLNIEILRLYPFSDPFGTARPKIWSN